MKRIITGVLLASLIFAILYFRCITTGWIFMMLAAGVGLHEYFTMTLAPAQKQYRNSGIILGLLIIAASYQGTVAAISSALLIAILGLIMLIMVRYQALTKDTPSLTVLDFLARFVFGITYIGFFGAHVILTLRLTDGSLWLILLFLITGMSDTCAYYTGRAIGRHKLCPSISPGKTIEGFIGGLVGATASAIVLGHYLFPELRSFVIGSAAVILACLGVLGDLIESVLKRALSVKDSGSILPGHGGILDRMDSMLLTAPFYYYMIMYIFPRLS